MLGLTIASQLLTRHLYIQNYRIVVNQQIS
ncbi:uncharacterized protein METZ01_LOCUS286708 [marine metagenome]|uniref:Uncharacterized protein n=1 Tax=marine metagenome TaxID=408172 RepID=A0A382LAD3_9ZZZZ